MQSVGGRRSPILIDIIGKIDVNIGDYFNQRIRRGYDSADKLHYLD